MVDRVGTRLDDAAGETSRLARAYLLRPRTGHEQHRLDRVVRQATQLLPACDGAELLVWRPVVETVAASDERARSLARERRLAVDVAALADVLVDGAGLIDAATSPVWRAWQRRAAATHGVYSWAGLPLAADEVRDTALLLHGAGADPLAGASPVVVQAVADLAASTVRALALTALLAERPPQPARPRPSHPA